MKNGYFYVATAGVLFIALKYSTIKKKQKEKEYQQSYASYLPFSKKPLFEECYFNFQCISGCCYKNEFGESSCSEPSACEKWFYN